MLKNLVYKIRLIYWRFFNIQRITTNIHLRIKFPISFFSKKLKTNKMKKLLFAFFLISIFTFNSLSAQELTMFSGGLGWEFYQDDKKIDKKHFKKLLSDVPISESLWKKGNLNLGIGIGLLGAEVGFGIWAISNDNNNRNLTVPIIGVAVTGISAIVFSFRSLTHRKNAILSYNRSFDKNNIGQRLQPSSNGFGLAWSF